MKSKPSTNASFRLLTYNIHKGYSIFNTRSILAEIKASIRTTGANLVCLQEVKGAHAETEGQFEFLADESWSHFTYGKNASYPSGNHGNAILSEYPILRSENEDVSTSRFERRGLLHSEIAIPNSPHPLHLFSVHLGLFQKDRHHQVSRILNRVASQIPAECPLIIAGDFNDWREAITHSLKKELDIEEAFLFKTGSHAQTFPGKIPFMPLDRIYYRNLDCVSVEVLKSKAWSQLSDHLPLLADFKLRNR